MSGVRDKFQKRLTCVAFQSILRKLNKLENCRKFWNPWKLFNIIQYYSIVSLDRPHATGGQPQAGSLGATSLPSQTSVYDPGGQPVSSSILPRRFSTLSTGSTSRTLVLPTLSRNEISILGIMSLSLNEDSKMMDSKFSFTVLTGFDQVNYY